MLFKLIRKRGVKRSSLIGGRSDADPTPPAWIEVLAIYPRKVQYQKQFDNYLVDCEAFCSSDHGPIVLDMLTIGDILGGEYSLAKKK